MAKLFKGSHAAGIFADMSVDGPQIGTLVAIIDRAKNLPNRKTMGKQNPYCAARLGKEAKKTPTDLRGGQTPRWDHELRFTVHESPDYYKLKVSVFNDDKKTDLIGETWIDLNNLIIPGGSQDDHWHPLQSRGKYSGEVRIEMTYYDTRQQDEAVLGKRREAADRVQGKQAAATTPTGSGLSGPRQLNAVKRRPLPTDPSGVAPPPLRQTYSEPQPQTAPPLHHPMPSRPIREQVQNMPAAPVPEPAQQPYVPRHHSEPSYDQHYNTPPQSRGYDSQDHYQREYEPPAPALPPAGAMRRHTNEPSYASHELPEQAYDSRPLQPRSHSDFDQYQPRDYRSAAQEPVYADPRDRAYESPRSEEIYSPLSPQYTAPPMSFGPVSTFTPRQSAYIEETAPLAYSRPNSSSGPSDEPRYLPHSFKALPPAHQDPRDVYHPEYATMQPRVDDEDEDGPPPPPPVHRSRMAQPLPPSASPAREAPSYQPSPAREAPSSYQPYSPGHSSHSNSISMPSSLVPGYETEELPNFDDHRGRRPSAHFDDEMMLSQPPGPGALVPVSRTAQAPPAPYESAVYPLRTSPRPVEERPTSSRGAPANPETRMITRKSVSPRPSISSGRERGSSIPFSPDSYNSFNPNASRSATNRDPTPVYDSPSQARDAALRAEIEPSRDLDQPIIGDDGREIDPSDHLPTDTWAPEPERKNRSKPEVILRFKHNARPTSRGNDTSSRNPGAPRVGFRSETTSYSADRKRFTPSHSPDPGTPPRGYESHGSYTQPRGYSTPTSTERPRSSRGSVSPSPGSRSPLYDYSPGPPIPNKVPISPGAPSYPVTMSSHSGGNPGMDALSRELKTIDIGSAGCSPGRAVRRYAPPRSSASMGYAS